MRFGVRCHLNRVDHPPRVVERRKGIFEIPTILPKHLAICMDGNRRWAIKQDVSLQTAYRKAETVAESTIDACLSLDIPALTLFAFSTENWKRDPTQTTIILSLFGEKMTTHWKKWDAKNICIQFIGDQHLLPKRMSNQMQKIKEKTEFNTGLHLTIALSYGGRQDLLHSVRSLAQKAVNGELDPMLISESDLEACLQSKSAFGSIGDPDLYIRTGGEQRLSNFMLWDMAYTELYFEEKLWPDFDHESLLKALNDFAKRERRFGR